MTLRVALIVDSAGFGGAEFYVTQLLERLRARHEPVLLASEHAPAELIAAAVAADVPVHPLPLVRSKRDVRGWMRLARTLWRIRPDLVHVNAIDSANNRHSMVACAALRLPFVVTLHAAFDIEPAHYRHRLGRILGRAARIITVSREVADLLIERFRVSRSKVRVVANGVQPRDPASPPPATVVRVGAVGRLTSQKGFDVLVRAVEQLVDQGLAVDVRVWGDGHERDPLVAASEGLPVRFVGTPCPVRDFVGDLDVFCLSSRWEGLPFALLEAMMAGIPCVATDVGDVREALGSTGIVVAPNSADALASGLAELVTDAARRQELGRAAHERARASFTTDAMVSATASIYDEVLERFG